MPARKLMTTSISAAEGTVGTLVVLLVEASSTPLSSGSPAWAVRRQTAEPPIAPAVCTWERSAYGEG